MKRMMMTVLVLIASTAVVGAAGLDLPRGKWWENDRVIQRIGLTEEQQKTISDLVYEHAMRMIDLNAGLKKAEFELGDLVDRDEFDSDAIRKSFAAFQAAKDRLEYERFEMLLAVRAELTAEQWKQLLEIRRFLERSRENRRPGEGTPDRRPPDGSQGSGNRPPADGVWN